VSGCRRNGSGQFQIERFHVGTSDIIATCAALGTLAAFIATFWQAYMTRVHNRKSVRPLLQWVEDRTANPGSATITYILRNHGPGPAILRDQYFTRAGTRFVPSSSNQHPVEELAQLVIGTKFNYDLLRFGLPGSTSVIPVGGEILIAEIRFNNQSLAQVRQTMLTLGNVGYHVEYVSIYDETFRLDAN